MMPAMAIAPPLADLRLGDVAIFLTVVRCGKVQGAARELRLPPSQVSKAVARLEEQLGLSLLVRSSHGVSVSDAAQTVLPRLHELLRCAERLRSRERASSALTVAAPSYLADYFIPAIAAAPVGTRVRALQLAPPVMRNLAGDNLFDVCLSIGKQQLPDSWASERVGELRKALFARPDLAARLGAGPLDVAEVRQLVFVIPVYTINGEYVPVDDGCPLSPAERRVGHEAQTIGLALEIAHRTGQVVFGPEIAGRRHVAAGTLVEVGVEGWDERDELYIACNVDRVLQRQRRVLADAVAETIARRGGRRVGRTS